MSAERPYSDSELLAIMAARRLEGGASVFAGVGLPLLAAVMARKTHTPRLIIVVEGGVFDPEMLPGRLPISSSDTPWPTAWSTSASGSRQASTSTRSRRASVSSGPSA